MVTSRVGAREVERIRHQQVGKRFVAEPMARDWAAVEEPLEVRVSGERWLVTMRTPGHDRELTAGLLWAEGMVRHRAELGSIHHCGRPGEPDYGNVIEVSLAPGSEDVWHRFDERSRVRVVNAACGVCGRESIDDLLSRAIPLEDRTSFDPDVLVPAVHELIGRQSNFALTGGVHAASLLSPAGEELATFEDVGRHNAVDKVIGDRRLRLDETAAGLFLCVSGRASFEIVQKAVMARCAGVVSLSAPSTLAIDTARRFGLWLLGFVREGSFSLYGPSGYWPSSVATNSTSR